jgi:adenylylsulfate kinase-like enzyme
MTRLLTSLALAACLTTAAQASDVEQQRHCYTLGGHAARAMLAHQMGYDVEDQLFAARIIGEFRPSAAAVVGNVTLAAHQVPREDTIMEQHAVVMRFSQTVRQSCLDGLEGGSWAVPAG